MSKAVKNKPRNPVVKNALQFQRHKVETNRKAREKRGYEKHKGPKGPFLLLDSLRNTRYNLHNN